MSNVPGRTSENVGKETPAREEKTPEEGIGPVSKQDIERLQDAGLNIQDPQILKAVSMMASRSSISRSPYPSAEMLREYESFKTGLSDHVISTIDEGIKARNRHNVQCDLLEERRKNRGQWAGILLSFFGVSIASGLNYLTGGWVLPAVIVIACVGGPGTATVLARYLDKMR
ncbi:MAG: hypothetical protein GVY13_09000 [Alphaproteobacteria bacterium]|nr:hypothetical protein [Alphaproteobacteria bacterium]